MHLANLHAAVETIVPKPRLLGGYRNHTEPSPLHKHMPHYTAITQVNPPNPNLSKLFFVISKTLLMKFPRLLSSSELFFVTKSESAVLGL